MIRSQLKTILDGLPQSGKCPICSLDSRFRCVRCKHVFYCSIDHQKADWKNHKPACTQFASTMQWPVIQLEESVKKDAAPTGEDVRRDYGFTNCKDATEESRLVGLYAGLIVLLKSDLVRLHEACISGKLKELITTEFEKHGQKSPNYDWFLENTEIVKNQYPLPDNETATSSSEPASTAPAKASATGLTGGASTGAPPGESTSSTATAAAAAPASEAQPQANVKVESTPPASASASTTATGVTNESKAETEAQGTGGPAIKPEPTA